MIDKKKNPIGYWLDYFEKEDLKENLEASKEVRDMVLKRCGRKQGVNKHSKQNINGRK
jgi:hypothetical protein